MAEKKTEKPIEKMAEKKKTEIEKPEVKEEQIIAQPEPEAQPREKVPLFKNGVTILRYENDVQKYLQDGWVVK